MKTKKKRQDGLSSDDVAVLYKIIRVMPHSDIDKPSSRFVRAREGYLKTMLSGCSNRRCAFQYACFVASNGDMHDCYAAINAVWFMPEFWA
ncbi:hypothetical protein COV88_00905 [Candidatus Saccharibacteria bacterium CG11_big_fil_rev_8_21_14_0_20_41_19]|nr:MAG: hypothetical protein AUK57_00380 [Candidatus Saccharibacteria bacterium CG2_30_41_52]PIQ71031.1 MAG: hypothetical protein COV88_00905 [Candidatus Saccharibacteria bacterium CG11_big_fil_rev_8_21_14_0_20_41_19]PIZ59434.1 MAG: hypothetical protein COY18_03545 [Candidatus Saccharibacteria bacterium CG_4_10_14_0_2_um_filter_41_11]PJC29387.1 MAG: hypothetical protein CO052_03650 [Candidatus Saccharibacteria bacterium CG_4_9_14_0_2_um_filter_41_9]PJE66066.1 MAG: hypothetical protein COU92_025